MVRACATRHTTDRAGSRKASPWFDYALLHQMPPMKRKRPEQTDESLGMKETITRKDFLNTTLLGMGAALLHAQPPAAMMEHLAEGTARAGAAVDPWTGPGGVGDYANSNGNTRAVIDAAHKIRDGAYAKPPAATDTGETYDLVIVGGGISGLTAAYYYLDRYGRFQEVPGARKPSNLWR